MHICLPLARRFPRAAVLLLVPVFGLLPGSAQAPMDARLAARAFQEARWASEDDGGNLWGKPLYGPMIFASPATREVMANQADAEGRLKIQDGVWVGRLPPEVGIANTATRWAGVTWTMVMWPLPSASANRGELMLHECWHRIQTDIGFPAPDKPQANAHLDTRDGRIWLRLEWRALSEALVALESTQEKAAIRDALLFRAWRRKLFPIAAAEEDRMELHEGLAEYTGVRGAGLNQKSCQAFLSGRLKIAIALRPSLPMSFAYETGPAYGLLLDATGKPWREGLSTASSLSALLGKLHGLSLPADPEAEVIARAKLYGGEEIIREETEREKVRVKREATYRRQLIEGPVLELPLPNGNYSFNPNEVFSLGAEGVIFPTSHLADAWGVLEVHEGVRLSPARNQAFVVAPADLARPSSLGWTLTLRPGWKLVPGERKGDFKVVQAP